MKKIIFTLLFCSLFSVLAYAALVQKDISDELLRLHIVANSNSEIDQQVKLKVRDEIIKSVGGEFSAIYDKKKYREELIKKTDYIKALSDKVLEENGFDYTSNVSFERLYIPRKSYNGLILPEGSYEGLIVRLGKAKGQNWWCVVYPPLCFTESTCGELSDEAREYLKQNLSHESYSLITEKGIDIKYKFKVIEIYQKIKRAVG